MKINTCTSQILRRTFVRQLTGDDCGQACIAMLLRYAGEIEKANYFLSICPSGTQSLLALRNNMEDFGFHAHCVTMTMDFLLRIEHPCILHTEDADGNRHYQICYGAAKSLGRRRFLMADPANQFYFIDAENLDRKWKTKAALYVEGLAPDLTHFHRSPLALVIASAHVPGIVWIIMPLLTFINAIFGIALSFLLQRGFSDNDIFNSRHIIMAFVILLLVISLFKGAFSYLRQVILMKVNRSIRRRLFFRLTGKVNVVKTNNKDIPTDDWTKRSFYEISLMQHALSMFVSILVSEGSLLIILLGAIFYTLPAAGFILTTLFFVMAINAMVSSSGLVYETSVVRQKSAGVEKLLTEALFIGGAAWRNVIQKETEHVAAAEQQALLLSKRGFLHEVVGALAVVIILGIASFRLYNSQISYLSLMFVVILSYVAISTTPRLYHAYLALAEGADAFMQFCLRTMH